ncbi:hypothetical protein ACJO2E_02675 [Marinobacter sp. M1N3S26]|uniref:hypothetical protein n=1 Tax=Marinobacter sp. M1N3S26 TaxID=3382299 RepID=UPI00387AEBF2
MSLPYENATSGDKALGEIQKILRGFGCQKFGSMVDDEEQSLTVQFQHRGKMVSVKASFAGYAAAWLKEHPYSNRMRKTRQEHERQAYDKASVAVYSILRDWIKGQVMAIETGILSFEGAFLGQILLPDGQTVLDYAERQDLLPGPGGDHD